MISYLPHREKKAVAGNETLCVVTVFITLLLILWCAGCDCRSMNFIGLTKEQVAEKLEQGPKMKNGSFRVLYPLPDSPPGTLAHHFHKNKNSLLDSSDAMKAPCWRVGFHSDGMEWHSYLLVFDDGVVVRQEDRRQPHWTLAEP